MKHLISKSKILIPILALVATQNVSGVAPDGNTGGGGSFSPLLKAGGIHQVALPVEDGKGPATRQQSVSSVESEFLNAAISGFERLKKKWINGQQVFVTANGQKVPLREYHIRALSSRVYSPRLGTFLSTLDDEYVDYEAKSSLGDIVIQGEGEPTAVNKAEENLITINPRMWEYIGAVFAEPFATEIREAIAIHEVLSTTTVARAAFFGESFPDFCGFEMSDFSGKPSFPQSGVSEFWPNPEATVPKEKRPPSQCDRPNNQAKSLASYEKSETQNLLDGRRYLESTGDYTFSVTLLEQTLKNKSDTSALYRPEIVETIARVADKAGQDFIKSLYDQRPNHPPVFFVDEADAESMNHNDANAVAWFFKWPISEENQVTLSENEVQKESLALARNESKRVNDRDTVIDHQDMLDLMIEFQDGPVDLSNVDLYGKKISELSSAAVINSVTPDLAMKNKMRLELPKTKQYPNGNFRGWPFKSLPDEVHASLQLDEVQKFNETLFDIVFREQCVVSESRERMIQEASEDLKYIDLTPECFAKSLSDVYFNRLSDSALAEYQSALNSQVK